MKQIWIADSEPSTRFSLYTRGNTGEVFPRVITALTGTLIGADVRRAQDELFVEMGAVHAKEVEPQGMGTGVFGGYLYGNASLARLFGVRMPGANATTADEQVFGTLKDLPEYRRSKGDRSVLASFKLTITILGMMRSPDLTPLDVARADATAWLATMPPLDTASDDELLAFVQTYPTRLGDSMKRLLHFSMMGSARFLLDRIVDGAGLPAGTTNRLVGGIDDVDSARLAQGMWALGRIVAEDVSLTAAFDAGLDRIAERTDGTSLAVAMVDFLAKYGHRGPDEYELATPNWSMDPRPVYAAVDRLRHAPPDRDPGEITARLQADQREALDLAMAKVGRMRRPMVRKSLAGSRAGGIARERAKDILVLENLGIRRALHELARRAAERGGPTDLRKAFCITADELAAFVADPASFAAVIDERAQTERYLNDRVPPPWFDGIIPNPSTWPLRTDAKAAAPASGTELSGIAVSGGRASGRARVIEDPADPRGLEAGEILVCAITDPSWTPLFLGAAAVVCDTGAMMSHAAIVARELGIPAVLSVEGITSVADGTMLDVDGDTGTVRVG